MMAVGATFTVAFLFSIALTCDMLIIYGMPHRVPYIFGYPLHAVAELIGFALFPWMLSLWLPPEDAKKLNIAVLIGISIGVILDWVYNALILGVSQAGLRILFTFAPWFLILYAISTVLAAVVVK